VLVLLLALAAPPAAASSVAAAPGGDAERGADLAALAGCEACHTAKGGAPYAGGYAIDTPYGTFYGPNITPDPTHGIGAWTQRDFARAMDRGRDPRGHNLYPAFPYAAFTHMTNDDVADLWAYLQTVPAAPEPDLPHELHRYRWRGALSGWKLMELRRAPLPPQDDPELARGQYLVLAVAHCQECHTPRNGIGGLKAGQAFAGGNLPPEKGPDIRPGQGWTRSDWEDLLDGGMKPDGDVVGGQMGRIVDEGTSQLSAEDRRAIIRYMMEVVPPGT